MAKMINDKRRLTHSALDKPAPRCTLLIEKSLSVIAMDSDSEYIMLWKSLPTIFDNDELESTRVINFYEPKSFSSSFQFIKKKVS